MSRDQASVCFAAPGLQFKVGLSFPVAWLLCERMGGAAPGAGSCVSHSPERSEGSEGFLRLPNGVSFRKKILTGLDKVE